LGYLYILQDDLSDSCYYFSYSSPDTLKGRILGADRVVRLLEMGDTACYLLRQARVDDNTASQVANIAKIRKCGYYLQSLQDTTLYLAGSDTAKMTNLVTENAGIYYLKESPTVGAYYLAFSRTSLNHTLIVDSVTKQLVPEHKDSIGSLFKIVKVDRHLYEDPIAPDQYTYLTDFPDSKGKGFYRFYIPQGPMTHNEEKWLSKDFYDYAALGAEGKSMMRAGSYTLYDLQLWVDTARGTTYNPYKSSFFIVKDVDTLAANFDSEKVEGFFLHVMDSTLVDSHEGSVIEVDGKIYNRLNFVEATRLSANQLQLKNGNRVIGESDRAINEYRFYIQYADETNNMYYLVTEAGYGDGGQTKAFGYLSVLNDTIYVGPRDKALKMEFARSAVSNEVIIIPALPAKEIDNQITIIGHAGTINILHAAGQPVAVYNMLGRLVAQHTLSSDRETIPASRGILIVKVGPVTRKVVVQ